MCLVAQIADQFAELQLVGLRLTQQNMGNPLKVDKRGIQKAHTDAELAYAHTQAYLSAFWDTGCRRQAGMTGRDMLITDRTGHSIDGICVCACVFDRWRKNFYQPHCACNSEDEQGELQNVLKCDCMTV